MRAWGVRGQEGVGPAAAEGRDRQATARGLASPPRGTDASRCGGPWWGAAGAWRVPDQAEGRGRACLKPPEPSPSLQPGPGTPVPWFGLPAGEGTGTDIDSVKSAPWSPGASSAAVPMVTACQCRVQRAGESSSPESSLGLPRLDWGHRGAALCDTGWERQQRAPCVLQRRKRPSAGSSRSGFPSSPSLP